MKNHMFLLVNILIGLMPENDIYAIIENAQNELFFIKPCERNEQLRKKNLSSGS